MDGSHCQNSPEPPLTHHSAFLAWATDGWATKLLTQFIDLMTW